MQFNMTSQGLHFKLERQKLVETFGKFVSFPIISGETGVEVKVKTSKDNEYTLRCYLRNDFPNSMPVMVVCSPDEPLKDRDGRKLETSYENHCLGYKNEYGLTMICHCREDRWDKRNMNLSQVFIKGLIWLEAYEIMKITGKSLSTYLPEMPMSEENQQELENALTILKKELTEVLENWVDQMMFKLNCHSVEELLLRLWIGTVPQEQPSSDI